MMIFLGYLVSIGYLATIILFFGFIQKKFKVNVEITRKILHILIGFTWVFMDIFWGVSYHQIIMCSIFVIVNWISRKFKIFPGIEREDDNHPGTVYYAVAMLVLAIASYVYNPMYIPFGMAVICLSFGDGSAPLMAMLFKKRNVKLVANKTLAGTLSCIAFSFLALCVFSICYKLDYSILSLLAISCLVGVCELFTQKGLDNFLITFPVAIVGVLITMGIFTQTFFWLVALSTLVVLLILLTKSLTEWGSLLAFVMMLVASFTASYMGFLLYVIPFVLIGVISKMRNHILKKRGENTKKENRNLLQVAINGGITMVLLIVFKVVGNIGILTMAIVSLSVAFTDSVSSDVGTLSSKQPFDICRFKRVERGTSGGMSLFGTFSGLVASLIMGAVSLLFGINLKTFAFVVVLGFFGMVVDSILGSTLQALYCCSICGKRTESKIHCDIPTKIIKGYKFVDNNSVNLLSNILVVGLSALWFAF